MVIITNYAQQNLPKKLSRHQKNGPGINHTRQTISPDLVLYEN